MTNKFILIKSELTLDESFEIVKGENPSHFKEKCCLKGKSCVFAFFCVLVWKKKHLNEEMRVMLDPLYRRGILKVGFYIFNKLLDCGSFFKMISYGLRRF